MRPRFGTGVAAHSTKQSVAFVPPPGTHGLVAKSAVQKPGVGVTVGVWVALAVGVLLAVCVGVPVSVGVGVTEGVGVAVGVSVNVGVGLKVGIASVYGLEVVLPMPPFCTGLADMVRVLLPGVESFTIVASTMVKVALLATATGERKVRFGPERVPHTEIGVPFTVPVVTPLASVVPGNTMLISVLVVMSQPSRLGTCATMVYVAGWLTKELDGLTVMNWNCRPPQL